MKICFLADAHSIHTRKWVNYFSEYNNEIHIISMRETDYTYDNNVHVHVLRKISSNKLSYFLLIKDVKKLVKEINPDILHSHYATSYGLYGRMCNRHPFVVSVWGSDVYDFPKGSSLKVKLLKYILNGAEKVCSTSNDMERETSKYYDKDILITPFGVELEKFICKVPILSGEYITIGLMKGLESIYGINYLIEAFAELVNEYDGSKELRLLIVGDGSERDALKTLCKSLKIDSNVIFTGNIDNDKVPDYINKMDIVCLPSLSESFGVAAIEACACGRPIIATEVGGLKEIISDGYNGYSIEVCNSRDIKEKLLKMLLDEEKMKVFSKNAINMVKEKYNWSNNAEIMKKMYDDLLK